MFNDTKPLYRSKGIWGGAAALLAGAAGLAGYTVGPAEQADIVRLGLDLVTTFGGLVAIFGRIRARKRIG